MKPVTSRATVKVNGEIILNRRGGTFRKGGFPREAVVGDSGWHGHMEGEFVPSQFSCNVTDNEQSEMDQFDVSDATILIETNSGKSYVMRNAVRTDIPELDLSEGQYNLVLQGPAAEKA